jgi:hypothetical protein
MSTLTFARKWRWVLAITMAGEGAIAGADLFLWHQYLLVLLPVVMACGLVFAIRLNTRTIASLELSERAKRRPDYRHIARIEREIYGEAFHHDGAPEVTSVRAQPAADPWELGAAMAALSDASQRASVSLGHVVRHGALCSACERRRNR